MKRNLLFLLFLLAFANFSYAYAFEIDGIYYTEPWDNSVRVEAGEKAYEGDIVIPSTVTFENHEYTVKQIDNETFANCIDLNSIVLPNTIERIGMSAFSGCTGLESVTLPPHFTNWYFILCI